MKNLRVTLIQSILHWENISANLEMFSEKISSVGETDLIVLPETFTTGFSMNPKFAESMSGSAVKWMKKLALEKDCVVCGSLMIQEDRKFYNRLVWMPPDGEFQTYDKRHLFCLSDEPKFFTASNERLIVELNGWKICPLICYDLRFPVWARNTFENGYDVLLYVANWPERRNVAWKTLLLARAIENQAYVIGANRVGVDEKNISHSGDSMVIDALGKILYHKEQEEDIFTIDLNYEELKKVREQLPFLKDADEFVLNPKSKIKSH
ncbi:MAG: amidohydrolase [Bacteroidetes bacterium]|nr:amidohydrolase [Bacteroidota bacterium]